jgi:hypothetical protein
VAFLALLAERKINNLRVINTPLEFDPFLATINPLKISVQEVLRSGFRLAAPAALTPP